MFIKNLAASVAFAAAALVLAAPLTASADQTEVIGRQTVHYSDQDLSSAAGARATYGRLRAAAYQACDASESAAPSARTIDNPCVRKALAGAVVKLNSAALTQVYIDTYRARPEGDTIVASAR
jgi:UrcA family protein